MHGYIQKAQTDNLVQRVMTDFSLLAPLLSRVPRCWHTIFCQLCYNVRNSSRRVGWEFKNTERVVLAGWCLSKLILNFTARPVRRISGQDATLSLDPTFSPTGHTFSSGYSPRCWTAKNSCKKFLHSVFEKYLPPAVTLKGWILSWYNVMEFHLKEGFVNSCMSTTWGSPP